MIQVKSKEEALEWANRCPLPEGGLMEIRQVFENCDFPPELQKKTADPLVYGIFSASLRSLCDVLAEVEAWTDREARRQSAIFQEIAEQMVINEVCLHTKTDVP